MIKVRHASSGGYMSVDRNEALEQNWDLLVKITRPLVKELKESKMSTARMKELAEQVYNSLQYIEPLEAMDYLTNQLIEVIKLEREECAKIAEDRVRCLSNLDMCREAEIIAKLIRERGGK